MIIDHNNCTPAEGKHVDYLEALNEEWFERGIDALAMLHRTESKGLHVVIASYADDVNFKTEINGLPVVVELRANL